MTGRKDQFQLSTDKGFAADSSSNRQERRKLEKIRKKTGLRLATKYHATRVQTAASLSHILENEGDETMLERELLVQNALLKQTLYQYSLYNIYRRVGVSEPTTMRVIFPAENETGHLTEVLRETKHYIKADIAALRVLDNQLKRLEIVYTDREERELIELMRSGEFTGPEIFQETARARKESIALMSMQLDWLGGKQEGPELATSIPKVVSIEPVLTESDITEERKQTEPIQAKLPFPLSTWELHFTDMPCSTLQSRLHPIGTSTWEGTLSEVERVTRGYRSIRPGSIVRSLVHTMVDKDTIQRALATRFRFSKERERDWIKIKRGHDRIGLLIDEQARTAIFCIEGRDIVYR